VPRDRDVVVHCKLGGRSAQAVEFLKSRGYTRVRNLAGGILRWIDEVDPSLPKYYPKSDIATWRRFDRSWNQRL